MKGSEARVCYMNAVTYVQFVVKCVYGSKELGCAKTRAATNGKKMKKKSTQRLMPDEDTLNHICLRANYLAYCQNNFQLSRRSSPIGNSWGINDGKCRLVRQVLPAFPASLPSQSAQSDEDSSDSDDIDDCSKTDSAESENDD